MTREPFIAHSELTNEIYIVADKEKYRVTEQAIKAVMAIKALEQEDILDKIRAELTEKKNILVKEARANTINPLCCYGLDYALLIIDKIIDKYKVESEGKLNL